MIVLLILLLTALYGYFYTITKRPKNFPPGPNWYPIVGSVPVLQKDMKKFGSLYAVYDEWSKRYNSSVIGFKLGNDLSVVTLDYPSVTAVHTSEVFDNRPDNFFIRLRTGGERRGITTSDGAIWTENRRFALRHLKEAGFGRTPMENALKTELADLIKLIDSKNSQPIVPRDYLPHSVMNVLWTFAAGEKIGRSNEAVKNLFQLLSKRGKAFDMSGGILNSLPWLRFLAPEKTGYNLLKKFNKDIYEFLIDVVNRHKRDYTSEKSTQDLTYAYIKEMQNSPDSAAFTETQLTYSIMDIFIAGSETTSTTLDLALMTMASYPDIQARVQKELDAVLQPNEIPSLEQKPLLPYIEAVIMEVHRFYTILPVTGPRRNNKEFQLNGYTIPKDTTIFIGLKSVLSDNEYWVDPEVFRPERFLNEHNEIINAERCIPFGLGRRRCLGEILARACLFIYFAGLLHTFNISLANGDQKPDIKLTPGIVLTPKPYQIRFSRREQNEIVADR